MKIIAIALPISAQQLITVGVNLMDTVMLSSMGDAQLSASTLGGQFINLFQIFCTGIGIGASVLTARYWGYEGAAIASQDGYDHAPVRSGLVVGIYPGNHPCHGDDHGN